MSHKGSTSVECICGEAYKDVKGGGIQDAKGKIGRFLEVVYMHKRIHSALG